MKIMSVKKKYRMFLRGSVFWVQDNFTGKQTSLGVKDRDEAEQLLQARNEAHRQPIINLQIARAYLSVSDPKAATRTWGDVMRHIVDQKHGETKHRWETAIKDKALGHLHTLKILDTVAEDFWLALKFKKVSTNVYLRRIHNFALGSNWLPVPVLQKSIWPKVEFKEKRATTYEEHRRIVEAEKNPERRAFYELAWHLGASQGDIANLNAEDIDWKNRILTYKRSKTGVDASMRFGKDVERVVSDLPSTGPLFPYLKSVRSGDRATEFRQRCGLLKIEGITLHSYRYAWAERAVMAGMPERYAQVSLGHNSKSAARLYAKKASLTVPSLEEYESEVKGRQSRRQEMVQ